MKYTTLFETHEEHTAAQPDLLTPNTSYCGEANDIIYKSDPIAVSGISLNASSLSLRTGQTFNLVAPIRPRTATNKNVTWSSSNETVATVSSNGLVTAIGAGDTVITVTTEDGGYSAQCSVHVIAVLVSAITISQSSISMEKGTTHTLTAMVLPTDADDTSIRWISLNEGYASVNDGVVTANNNGNTTIVAISNDGNFSATCNVTIATSVTGVSLSDNSIILHPSDEYTLVATVYPSEATNKNVTWASSVPSIATVDSNGKVTALATGSTTITVTTVDGSFTADCAVDVKFRATAITLNYTEYIATVSDTLNLVATFEPTNSVIESVTWASSNDSVATVDTNGTVTAIGLGTAIITATSENGLTSTCKFTVSFMVTYTAADKMAEVTSDDASGIHVDKFSDSGIELIGHSFSNGAGMLFFDSAFTTCPENAFKGANMTSIDLFDKIDTYSDYSFSGCASLSGELILDNVKIIGNSAFRDCSSITSVRIDSSISRISPYAFYGCTNIGEVKVQKAVSSTSTVPKLENTNSFENPSNYYVYIPMIGSSGAIYTNTPEWSTLYSQGRLKSLS